MQRIALKKATPGMVLAQPVTRPDGIVLVGEGHALTDAVITRALDAGVATVCVEGNPLGGDATAGNLGAVAHNLNFTFRRHTDNVFMMTLRNMLARYFAHRLAEQQAKEDAAVERREEASSQGGDS